MGVLKFGGGFSMSDPETRGWHGSSRAPRAKSSTSGCANVDLPRALARPVIILIEIGRHNYATRKDKRSHSDARQPIFHRSSPSRSPLGLSFLFAPIRTVRLCRGLNWPHLGLVASFKSLAALSISLPAFSAGPSFWQAEIVNPRRITATNQFSFDMPAYLLLIFQLLSHIWTLRALQ
jgi:hypothetical protein